jgi:hypothetical protein
MDLLIASVADRPDPPSVYVEPAVWVHHRLS